MQQLGTSIARAPVAALTPGQRNALRAIQSQKRVTAYPYYSTVTIVADTLNVRPGPYTYNWPRGSEVRAFSYGKGEALTNAGSPATVGTPVDTNLVQGSETISGENVEIHGIAIQLVQQGLDSGEPLSAQLLAAIQRDVSVDLSLNGDQNRFNMGRFSQLPGAGGLMGPGQDAAGAANINGGTPERGFANNGWPTRSNFFRMPEGLVWRNKGHADSQLNIIFRAERALSVFSGGSLANLPNGLDLTTAAGIQGYNYPLMVEVTFVVHLLGRVVGPRTRSA